MELKKKNRKHKFKTRDIENEMKNMKDKMHKYKTCFVIFQHKQTTA